MSENYQKQFDQFRADIAQHTIIVKRNDGLYRHLRCSRGGKYAHSFEVITWPGYLCYCGDMGCFVFTRLPDMFEFFRGRVTAMIDRDYIAEKAVAVDKPDGLRGFSEELFEAAVKADFESFTEDWSEEDKARLWEEIDDCVLQAASDGPSAAIEAAMSMSHNGRDVCPDFYEHQLEEFTSRFVWCCYAIPWAIEQYDAAMRLKEAQPRCDR